MRGEVRTDIYAFIALMVLLVLTVGISFIPLGFGNVIATFGIACAKAAVIALFFMEARHSISTVKVAIVTVIIWSAIFGALSFADYLTRPWHPNTLVGHAPWVKVEE